MQHLAQEFQGVGLLLQRELLRIRFSNELKLFNLKLVLLALGRRQHQLASGAH